MKKKIKLLVLIPDTFEELRKLGVENFVLDHYTVPDLFPQTYFVYPYTRAETEFIGNKYIIKKISRFTTGITWLKPVFFLIDTLVYLSHLYWLVTNEKIDLIRTRGVHYQGFIGSVLGKLTRRPCIVSVHTDLIQERRISSQHGTVYHLLGKFYATVSLNLATRIFAVSNFVRSQLILMGANPVKVKFVPNRVNIEKFQSPSPILADKFRLLYRIKPTDIVLLYIGRLDKEKNPILILEAVKEVKQKISSLKVLMVGDGKLKPEVESFIIQFNLTGNVILTGNISNDELPAVYHLATLFILPSFYEGFGIVLIEAQAAGIPILVADIPGVKDIVNTKNALFFHPYKVESLVTQLLFALNHPELLYSLKEEGKRTVTQFDEKKIEDLERQYYSELLR